MDFVTTTLGLSPPFGSARSAVMVSSYRLRQQRQQDGAQQQQEELHRFLAASDSIVGLNKLRLHPSKKHHYLRSQSDSDDDTASTVSITESFDEDDSTSSLELPSVSFADSIVTEVRFRPATTPEERKTMFYCDADYREFRKEFYMWGRREPRDPVVSFSDDVVSDVHVYPAPANLEEIRSTLYYTESDLKRFLAEFVESLNSGSRS